jgi:lantibiotic modifying enzyme
VALLFGYLARVTGDAGHRDAAGALLDEAAGHVAAAPTSPSLFHGFPGVAWAADHVRSLLGEAEPALHDDIDAAVEAWLASPAAAARGFDVVTGLAGLGVYALERAGVPAADRCVDRVVAQLARAARRAPGGLVWIAPDRPDRIDLGLAHGIPGAIALLARCAVRGAAAGATARGLLDGAVTWLLTRRRGDGGFPPCIAGGRPAAPGRDGWCYGGAAFGLALVRASRIGDPAWLAAGLDIARTAARRPASDTGVRDAGLCHGAAALGLIYQRLYHATGDPALRDAARDWVLRILDHREPADRRARGELASTAGFFQATTDGRIPAAGLMNGAAGIGLVLLAASSDVAPDWDRALLLDA